MTLYLNVFQKFMLRLFFIAVGNCSSSTLIVLKMMQTLEAGTIPAELSACHRDYFSSFAGMDGRDAGKISCQ